MSVNVLMPALSPTMEKGNLAKWLKKEGDVIKSGDVLAEIETDKATMEVEAIDEGVLAKIVVPEGTSDVPVNDLIAIIASEGEDAKAVAASGGSAPKEAPKPAAAPAVAAPALAPAAAAPAVSPAGRVVASAAPKIAVPASGCAAIFERSRGFGATPAIGPGGSGLAIVRRPVVSGALRRARSSWPPPLSDSPIAPWHNSRMRSAPLRSAGIQVRHSTGYFGMS